MTKSSKKREERNKLLVRALCIVLSVALVGTMVLTLVVR